jgi:lactate permease
MWEVFLAASPILLVLVGMIVLKKPAVVVTPIALAYTVALGMVAFGGSTTDTAAGLIVGLLDGTRIVWLILGAFTILLMMIGTGAMDRVKEAIAGVTDDRRVHVLIIAVMFGVFLEGAAGAGTPAAIGAPFLVGLGFSPLSSAVATLIANSVPVSWGGAGVTTIMGIEPVREYMTVMEASAAVGRIHMVGAILLPFLVTLTIFGRKGTSGLLPFLLFSGGFMAVVLFCLSSFVGPELTSMTTGLATLVAALFFLRLVGTDTPDEFLYTPAPASESRHSAARAFSPYILLLVLLPVVRYSFPLSVLARYGYTVWVGAVVMASAFLGSLLLGAGTRGFLDYLRSALKKVMPALVAMCSLLALSDIMTRTGMIAVLASALAPAAGPLYPALAVAVGALGSFMTGTNLGSNIMFGPMHADAALALGQNPVTVFAGQNAGGAIGNMICPNNVVAVATTVGILGQEGVIMKRVAPAFFALLLVYGILALVYTHSPVVF